MQRGPGPGVDSPLPPQGACGPCRSGDAPGLDGPGVLAVFGGLGVRGRRRRSVRARLDTVDPSGPPSPMQAAVHGER
ncbi:MYXO-CTERM sorting domain-containing protein [Streptomyces umbrinus]